jgi:hypothetical protein
LLLDGGHSRWQESTQAKDVALGFVEAGVLVEERPLQKLSAGVGYLHDPAWMKALD